MKIKKKLLSMLTIGSMVMSLFTPITPKAADIEVKQGDFFMLGEGDSQSLWFCFSTGSNGFTKEPGTFLMSYYAVKEMAMAPGDPDTYGMNEWHNTLVAKYLDGDFKTEYNTAAFESLIKYSAITRNLDGAICYEPFFLPGNSWTNSLYRQIPDLLKATNVNGEPVEWWTWSLRINNKDCAVVKTDGTTGAWGYNPAQTESRWVRPAFQLDVSKISSYTGSGTKEDPYRLTPITPKAADIEVNQGDFFMLGEGDSQSLWFCFSTGSNSFTKEPGTFLMSYYAVKEMAMAPGDPDTYGMTEWNKTLVAKYLDGDFKTEYNTAAFESLIKYSAITRNLDGAICYEPFFLPGNSWTNSLYRQIPDLLKATNVNGEPVEWWTWSLRINNKDCAVVKTDGTTGAWGYNPKQTDSRWVRPAFQLDLNNILSYTGSGTKEDPYRLSSHYTVSASAGAGGTAKVEQNGSEVTEAGHGTEVTFTATANDGYTFASWSDGSTENPHNVTVTENTALTASFTRNAYVEGSTPVNAAQDETNGKATGFTSTITKGGSGSITISSITWNVTSNEVTKPFAFTSENGLPTITFDGDTGAAAIALVVSGIADASATATIEVN